MTVFSHCLLVHPGREVKIYSHRLCMAITATFTLQSHSFFSGARERREGRRGHRRWERRGKEVLEKQSLERSVIQAQLPQMVLLGDGGRDQAGEKTAGP